MNHTPPAPFTLPSPLAALTSRLPAFPGSMLLVTALNLGVARQLPRDVGDMLLNKRLRIHVRDARVTFDFTWTGGAFAPRARHAETDLCIAASAHDFLLLAQRQQDPDTLFFNRRLCIEGDTATGVHIKNLLDALDYDWPAHFRDVLGNTLGTAAFAVFERTIGRRFAAR